MTPRQVLFAAALALPGALAAQAESGGFIVRLGNDTVAVERFTRSADRLEGRFAARAGQFVEWRYAAGLGANGRVRTFEMILARGGGPGAPAQRRAVTFQGDSAIVTVVRGDSTRTLRLAAPEGTAPFINHSFALYELSARAARAAGRDTFVTALLSPGANEAWRATVVRAGADSLVLTTDNGLGVRLQADRAGRVAGANGHGSTQQVDVERTDGSTYQAMADGFATRPLAGQLSPRDTARATIGGAAVWVDYGRPSRRGREIFGNVVPWGQVWRTGANAATQLGTAVDLVVGGATIPAGTYTLWTIPAPEGWTLIVNRQHGQWGTEYAADSDLVRVPMAVERLAEPVERFAIALDPRGDGAVLRLEWDRTRATVAVAKR